MPNNRENNAILQYRKQLNFDNAFLVCKLIIKLQREREREHTYVSPKMTSMPNLLSWGILDLSLATPALSTNGFLNHTSRKHEWIFPEKVSNL